MNRIVFSSKSDEYPTPDYLYNELNNEFKFTLDPCSTDENAKCSKHYTINDNGLMQSWENEIVFCNPPYSNVGKWVEKAYQERNNATIVMLIPARTDTKWFHNYIYHIAEIRFIKGRIKFDLSVKDKAPFPSMIVIYRRSII